MSLLKPLTNKELDQIENRIEEIKQTIAICNPNRDADVIANLNAEMDEIHAMLGDAEKVAYREEMREKSGLLRFRKKGAK